jgi:hypothetical protein
MKLVLLFLGCVTSLLLGCNDGKPIASDPAAKEVQAAWEEYQSALLNKQGSNAAQRVTQAAFDYYSEIRDLALRASRQELKQMAVGKQLTVMLMRARVEPAQLRQMSGRDLFVHSVDNGWIGNNHLAQAELRSVKVNNNYAAVSLGAAGTSGTVAIDFIKQEGAWKLDPNYGIRLANLAFEHMQSKSGLNAEEFVNQTVTGLSGKRIEASDWDPK